MNDFIFDFDGSIPEFEIVVQHVSSEGGGGGQTIEVDSELSTTSNNPVKNKVITTALNGKVSASQLATVATSGSYNDLTNKPAIPSSFPVDVELSETSTNPVQNAAITTALGNKMNYPAGGVAGYVLQKTAEGAQWASIGTPSQEQIYQAVTAYIATHPESLNPLSSAVKAALLQIAEKVAYIDEHGEDYYDALDAALNAIAVLSITAVFTQGSAVIYDTDTLDSLKQYLVVTAYYDDGTSADVTSACTLSGTLTEGTSTITATYQEKTATFNVTVSTVTIPTIRVFVGKGVSGSSIIDNANRALSEPIPFANEAPISIQWDGYSADNAKLAIKNTVTDVNTIDTTGYTMIPASAIGTGATGYDSWVTASEERCCGSRPQGVWAYITFPSSSGYMRLLFAGAQDMSVPIPSTISGNVTIKGVTYQLVEADISDFE